MFFFFNRAYNAINIADFVVNFCNDIQRPISNLKLQKILYYIQGNALKCTGEPIIDDDFYAWQHGPVIPSVYRKFSKYAASSIKRQNNESIEKIDGASEDLIKATILDYIDYGAWELVYKTHEEDPWKYIVQVYGYNSIIPLDSLKNYFCEQ
jgi:Uncharacterized phage-associated protein